MNNATRVIVHNPRFEKEFRAIEADPKRRDEIIQGVDLLLSRRPDKGTRIPNSHLYAKEVADLLRQRRLFVYYTFNKKKVYLISIVQIRGATIWP